MGTGARTQPTAMASFDAAGNTIPGTQTVGYFSQLTDNSYTTINDPYVKKQQIDSRHMLYFNGKKKVSTNPGKKGSGKEVLFEKSYPSNALGDPYDDGCWSPAKAARRKARMAKRGGKPAFSAGSTSGVARPGQAAGMTNNPYFGYNKHTYNPAKAEGKSEFAPDFEKAKTPGCTSGDDPEAHQGSHAQFFEYIPPEVAKIKRVDGAGQKAIFEMREGGNDSKFEWPEGTRPEKLANGQCFPSGPKKMYTSPAKKGTYGMLGTNIGAFGAGDNQLGRPTELNYIPSPYDEAQRVHRAEAERSKHAMMKLHNENKFEVHTGRYPDGLDCDNKPDRVYSNGVRGLDGKFEELPIEVPKTRYSAGLYGTMPAREKYDQKPPMQGGVPFKVSHPNKQGEQGYFDYEPGVGAFPEYLHDPIDDAHAKEKEFRKGAMTEKMKANPWRATITMKSPQTRSLEYSNVDATSTNYTAS